MDGKWDMEAGVAMLKRIVALFLSLADLAERAAARSPAVRAMVIGILRPAAFLARRKLVRDCQALGLPVPVMPAADANGDSVDQALYLAATFRLLAWALDDLADLIMVWSCGNDLEYGRRRRMLALLKNVMSCGLALQHFSSRDLLACAILDTS